MVTNGGGDGEDPSHSPHVPGDIHEEVGQKESKKERREEIRGGFSEGGLESVRMISIDGGSIGI